MSLKLSINCKLAFLLSIFLLVVSAPLATIPAPTKSAGTPLKTARDVAQLVLAAYGGADIFKKANDAPFKGTAKKTIVAAMSGAANDFDLLVYGNGDKFRVETDVLGEHVTSAFNGDTAWSQFGDWVSKDTATPTKEAREELEHGLKLILALNNPTSKLELLPSKSINGKNCEAIKVTALGQSPATVYIDPESHLISRIEYIGLDREQGILGLKAFDYLDYRPVSGSPLPFKSVEFFDGKKLSETVMQEVDYNYPITDSLFAMPRESEVAQVYSNPVTVPFEMLGDYIVVKVRLNNNTEEKFVVDTGASQTVLDKKTAQKLGTLKSGNFSITTGGNKLDVNYMTLSSLSLNDVTLDNVTAMVYDISSLSLTPGTRIAGLLGANVLRRFLVTIDYHDKVLILANPHSVAIPKGAAVLPVIPVFSAAVPVVKGNIDDKLNANFLVDTGAAFNNLPFELARQLVNKPVMPVSQGVGLDGRKVNMGAVRFKTLKLESLVVPDPVFAISPPNTATSPTGLFAASALGILGNPTWRRYRITLDYRNERLIVEQPENKQVFDQHTQRLKQINNEYLKTKNYNLAIAQYTELAQASRQSNDTANEALSLMQMGACYTDAFASTHNIEYATMATTQFQKAVDASRRAQDKQLEAKALANWADLFLKSADTPQSQSSAQSLIAKASSLCPTEPSPYAAMGTLFLKMGRADMASAVWDQTLLLDPANWGALWGKYELSKNDPAAQAAIAAQLKRYYPDVPDVVAIQKAQGKPAQAKTTQAKPAGKLPLRSK